MAQGVGDGLLDDAVDRDLDGLVGIAERRVDGDRPADPSRAAGREPAQHVGQDLRQGELADGHRAQAVEEGPVADLHHADDAQIDSACSTSSSLPAILAGFRRASRPRP
ncbi:MAG: hypothetical protein U1E17_06340 [Geminicoccaceae bacterium]